MARKIMVERDLRVRFPTRGPEFDDGIEIGLAMGRMADQHACGFDDQRAKRRQLVSLARRLGYRVRKRDSTNSAAVAFCFEPTASRPALRLIRCPPASGIEDPP